MGRDKATLTIGTETLAARAARVLQLVCRPVVEVGPGHTTLLQTCEHPPGAGPLAALLAGCAALEVVGGPVLLLGCDLPFIEADALAAIADWPGDASVVPMVAGRPQYVCARWSAAAIATGRAAFAAGERALGVLATVDALMLDEDAHALALADVDTPDDLRRLGLS